MADTAFQKQYRQEFVAGFEKRESLARRTCTTEVVIKGNEAVFLVADSGGATAVTRGVNGDIPTRPDNNNQYTATLAEWHDLPEKTDFNIFASQGNQRMIMQHTSIAVVNRKIDTDIHTALALATPTWGSAAIVTKALINVAMTKLANAFADTDAQLWALITPAMYAYMTDLPSFSSHDYIDHKRFEGVRKDKAFSWWGVNWIIDAALPGNGTSSETCFMYSQNAIGHAMDKERLDTVVGYDEKQAKSWARVSGIFGSKLLQNSGVVKMLHNGAALA